MSEALRQQFAQESLTVFGGNGREYKLGSILASALYHAGQSLGRHEALQSALIASYSDASADNEGFKQLIERTLNNQVDFNLVSVSWVLIKHVNKADGTGDLSTALCNQLIDRLQIPATELVGPGKPCPPRAQGGTTTCRTLPPFP
jgi:hypothetical protein